MAVGASLDGFSIGDGVVEEVSNGCVSCGVCRRGSYYLCPDRWEVGVLGRDDVLSERFVNSARSAYRVAASVVAENAALTEPFAVANRAVQRLALRPSSCVLVVGAETVGTLVPLVYAHVLCVEVTGRDSRAD